MPNKKPTIYEIKRNTIENQPFYFSRRTLKAFNQSMSDFKVIRYQDKIYICAQGSLEMSAPLGVRGSVSGYSIRQYTGDDLKTVDDKKQKIIIDIYNK